MEQDWEYIAGRNQASRQYHKSKRKEAELELATLRAELAKANEESERLAQKLDRAVKHLERAVTLIDDRHNIGGTIQRGYHTGMMRSFIKSCAKEALK